MHVARLVGDNDGGRLDHVGGGSVGLVFMVVLRWGQKDSVAFKITLQKMRCNDAMQKV